jgi:hypothetical protein
MRTLEKVYAESVEYHKYVLFELKKVAPAKTLYSVESPDTTFTMVGFEGTGEPSERRLVRVFTLPRTLI